MGRRVGAIGASRVGRVGRRLLELLRPFDFAFAVSLYDPYADPYADPAEAAALDAELPAPEAPRRRPDATVASFPHGS